MNDLLWIIPNLNENLPVLKESLLRYQEYAERHDHRSEIVVSEGGSEWKCVAELKDFCTRNSLRGSKMRVELCLPMMRPNKNLGILNLVEKYETRCVVVIDADWVGVGDNRLRDLIEPLFLGEAEMTLASPDIKSGRMNKLILNPLFNLFFPEVAEAISFPLNGMLGIRYDLLSEIVATPDYFWDWGGEPQIIIHGFQKTKGRVKTFDYTKTDSRKRTMVQKMSHARQILRSIIYEAWKDDNLGGLKKRLLSFWKKDKRARTEFLKWQEEEGIEIMDGEKGMGSAFDHFLEKSEKDLLWIENYLGALYDSGGPYELEVLRNITVDSVLKTLFGKEEGKEVREPEAEKIKSLNLVPLSTLATLIFATYLEIWLERGNAEDKGFKFFVELASLEDTEFVKIDGLREFRKKGLTSVDVDSLSSSELERLLSLYNDPKKEILEKNKEAMEIL